MDHGLEVSSGGWKRAWVRLGLVTAVALALTAVGVHGVAQALDAKTLLGGGCLPLLPAASPYDPWTQIGAAATNRHTVALTYMCAVVPRDNETTVTGLSTATISVQVPANSTLSCTMKSLSEFGAAVDTSTVTSTNNGAAAVNVALSFGANINVSVNNGAYGISCAVPANGKILSYRWAEN